MLRRSPSIEDIARAAGVANSTVSRALRDSPLISLDVRSHIQRLAREMGYTPNSIAQSLQNQQTNTIGLVVTSISDPFFGDVMRGVEEIAHPAGLSIFLGAGHNNTTHEAEVIETFHRRRVDGILVASSQVSDNQIARLSQVRIPIVLVNSNADVLGDSLRSVDVDDARGTRQAVEHLLKLGHRNIGYLGAANRPRSNKRRLNAYLATLTAAGVPIDPSLVVIAPADDLPHYDDASAGQALLEPLLRARATAIVCYNDMVAVGVLQACRERGIDVPGQLSVVGFDDIEIARYMAPALTTVRQPRVELGRAGMQLLLDLMYNRPVQDHSLEPHLVVRASSAPPNAV